MFLVQKPRYLFYIIAFLLPIQVGIYVEQVLGITFTPQLITGILLFIIIILNFLISRIVTPIPLFGLWFIFVSLSSIAFMRNPAITNPIQGAWVIFRLAIVNALIYPAYWWFFKDPRKTRLFFTVLSASAALSGIIAVIQTITNGNLLSGVFTNHRFLGFLFPFPPEVTQENVAVLQAHFWFDGIFRGHGMFYRANGFGAFMSVVVGITWGMFRFSRPKLRLMFLVLLLAEIAGVIVSFSRTAWVAVLFSIFIAVCIEGFFGGRRKQFLRIFRMAMYIFLLLLSIVIISLQIPSIADRFSTVSGFQNVGEVSWRIEIWKKALHAIIDHPILGTGNQIVTTIPVGGIDSGFGSHNLFVGIAFETGLLSFFIFLFFVFCLFLTSWKGYRYSNELQDKMISFAILIGSVDLIIVGMGTSIFDIENIIVIFWFMLAAAINMQYRIKNNIVNLPDITNPGQ